MDVKMEMLQDMELQKASLHAGQEYISIMFKDLKDAGLLARIKQAVGAGYSKGFRDASAIHQIAFKQVCKQVADRMPIPDSAMNPPTPEEKH